MIYSLCDLTETMLEPWKDAGFETTAYDLQTGTDILDITDLPDAQMVFAFPPCDDLSVSGARWMQGKGLVSLARSILLVGHCAALAEASGAPWVLENPVSTLSTYWRKPDARFDPWMYGDPYFKATCLWYGNDFKMPLPISGTPPPGTSKTHILHQAPGPERKNVRSATPPGFARAVFDANHKRVT